MIMHPANPKLDGQDLSAIRDPTALPCSTKWSSWPASRRRPGQLPLAQARRQRAGGQTSYIQLFEPWGWVIGSGVYIDDVQAEFAASCATPRWSAWASPC
jgi:methyl-accepting chemotaxis protein